MRRRKSQMGEKKPLYRKVNTRTHHVRHRGGGEARYERNTKAASVDERQRGSMHSDQQLGRDYTPLFKFLLSRVGEDWDGVYSEAVERLDSPDPIFWMVARDEQDKYARVTIGETSHFSGLYVDADNRLQKVDPDLTVEQIKPNCACCTHTFNGVPLTQAYVAEV